MLIDDGRKKSYLHLVEKQNVDSNENNDWLLKKEKMKKIKDYERMRTREAEGGGDGLFLMHNCFIWTIRSQKHANKFSMNDNERMSVSVNVWWNAGQCSRDSTSLKVTVLATQF